MILREFLVETSLHASRVSPTRKKFPTQKTALFFLSKWAFRVMRAWFSFYHSCTGIRFLGGPAFFDLGLKNTDTHCIVGSIMNNIVDVWKFGCLLTRSWASNGGALSLELPPYGGCNMHQQHSLGRPSCLWGPARSRGGQRGARGPGSAARLLAPITSPTTTNRLDLPHERHEKTLPLTLLGSASCPRVCLQGTRG